ncbi:MAG: hypothetical protein WAU28_01090, partial [Candidatus Moraniibacteriota bacterium]
MKYMRFVFVLIFSVSLFFGGIKELSAASSFAALLSSFGGVSIGGKSIEELISSMFPPEFSAFLLPDTINSTKTVSWSNTYSSKALVTHAILGGSWWVPA